MQVHFHSDNRPFTMVLSVRSAATLGTDLPSAIAVISNVCRSNALVFLSAKDRVANFPDYDCTLWFLSSCPKVSIRNVILYAADDEVAHVLIVCSRYPDLAGLIVNVSGMSGEEVRKTVNRLVEKRDVECPVLVIHSLAEQQNDWLEEMKGGEGVRAEKKVSATCSPDEVVGAIRGFVDRLLVG